MKPGMGKNKGNSFEREVSVALSNWISNKEKDDVFWRSATSGGRSTVALKRGKKLSNQVGDLSCIDPIGSKFIGVFAVECKFYASLDFQGLLTGKGKLLDFWKEIGDQAETHNKLPLLVAKQNRMEPMVCVDQEGLINLGLDPDNILLTCRPFDLNILPLKRFVTDCVPFV